MTPACPSASRSACCSTLGTLLTRPALAAGPAKRLLIVTVTKGFRHDSIPVAEQVLRDLGAQGGGWTVDYARTDADLAQKMSADGLRAYDGVVFANTTGDLPLPDRQAFLDWLRAGHAFAGMHAAADTFHGFPGYLQMLGGEFKTHGPQVGVTLLNADPGSPATAPLGSEFAVPTEEIYQFKNFEPDQVHLLLYLDRHPNDHTPGLYPLAWCRQYGKGRVFYTALGHRQDVWTAPWYQQHLLGGLRWALGEAGATPSRARFRPSLAPPSPPPRPDAQNPPFGG